MKTFLVLLGILLAGNSYTQDAAPFNKVNVNVAVPLQFVYNNAFDLLTPKVIHNALELAIKIKQENTSVYAQTQITGPSKLPELLALRLVNKTSPNAAISQSVVNLSEVPALLFTQPKSEQPAMQYSFFYDLILNPSTTMIAPGNYNFSISFTITAQ